MGLYHAVTFRVSTLDDIPNCKDRIPYILCIKIEINACMLRICWSDLSCNNYMIFKILKVDDGFTAISTVLNVINDKNADF
jgi:hypothetical protein